MSTILITGGAGFIGSHVVRHMLAEEANRVVNLDLLTYAANKKNLAQVEHNPRHHFVRGDIRDKELLNALFGRYAFDTVIHCAAESHVEHGFLCPELFFSVNVMGTGCLLDAAKTHWAMGDPRAKEYLKGARFIQVSTNEVYGSLGQEGTFTENSPLNPNNPYAASKAGAELLALSYYRSFNLPVIITRGTNTFGPNQHREKLIPSLIAHYLKNEPLPVHGCGQQVRDWIYVKDHCSGIQAALKGGVIGEAYNIGTNCEHTVLDIARRVAKKLNIPQSRIAFVEDRIYQDSRFSLDCQKIRSRLHWQPVHEFETMLDQTIDWYLANPLFLTDAGER